MLAVTFTYIQEASRFYVARSLPTSLTSFPTLLPLFNPATPASLLVFVTSKSLDLPSAHTTFLHCSQRSLQSGICSRQHQRPSSPAYHPSLLPSPLFLSSKHLLLLDIIYMHTHGCTQASTQHRQHLALCSLANQQQRSKNACWALNE